MPTPHHSVSPEGVLCYQTPDGSSRSLGPEAIRRLQRSDWSFPAHGGGFLLVLLYSALIAIKGKKKVAYCLLLGRVTFENRTVQCYILV